MRRLIAVFLACLLASAASAAEVRLLRVWPKYRTAYSFVRISEYFNGRENPGRQIYLRTHPEDRAGFYFLTRIDNNGAELPGAKIQLQVITPWSPQTVTYTYPVDLARGQRVYQVGLTGPDWRNPEENPVAWRLAVISPEGQELVAKQSYMWSKPDAK